MRILCVIIHKHIYLNDKKLQLKIKFEKITKTTKNVILRILSFNCDGSVFLLIHIKKRIITK